MSYPWKYNVGTSLLPGNTHRRVLNRCASPQWLEISAAASRCLPRKAKSENLKTTESANGPIRLHHEPRRQDRAAETPDPERHLAVFFPGRQDRPAWPEWLG